MLRITLVVFVLAVVAMVSSNKALTKAVIKASGNADLIEGGATLYRDAEGMAESCDALEVTRLSGISNTGPGTKANEALAFATKLGESDNLAGANAVACDAFACPGGTVIGACAYN